MRVLILGASGIVGQHMRLCVPDGVEPIWARRTADPITEGIDLEEYMQAEEKIEAWEPEVIVNLAGHSSVDEVEGNPNKYWVINGQIPGLIALKGAFLGARFIHISSQAVKSDGGVIPVNAYGRQKLAAEIELYDYPNATIMRLSFILGIRPLPHVGRQNPIEAILAGQSPQTCDRFFSPLFAMDAAELIWEEIMQPSGQKLIECGIPEPWSRWNIAKLLNDKVEAVPHCYFTGLAARAINTTYKKSRWRRPMKMISEDVVRTPLQDRAAEICMFLGNVTASAALQKLEQGFGPLHNEVSEDFRRSSPHMAADLLNWYRTTEAYIWELSAYHEDPGFNYAGMVNGIAEALKLYNCKTVLCLGDGIGDMTLAAHRAGMVSFYHDLPGSRTAAFAAFRLWRNTGREFSMGWCSTDPSIPKDDLDAIVALDFLEHVPNVEDWVGSIYRAIRPGGYFVAQNAFGCGSGSDGPMPMHLACNDRFIEDWDPLLKVVGFEQLAPQWYRRPE
jgi:dTDP-4-dehydrorhamnose reductase/SAM-dependent methyltransferase